MLDRVIVEYDPKLATTIKVINFQVERRRDHEERREEIKLTIINQSSEFSHWLNKMDGIKSHGLTIKSNLRHEMDLMHGIIFLLGKNNTSGYIGVCTSTICFRGFCYGEKVRDAIEDAAQMYLKELALTTKKELQIYYEADLKGIKGPKYIHYEEPCNLKKIGHEYGDVFNLAGEIYRMNGYDEKSGELLYSGTSSPYNRKKWDEIQNDFSVCFFEKQEKKITATQIIYVEIQKT